MAMGTKHSEGGKLVNSRVIRCSYRSNFYQSTTQKSSPLRGDKLNATNKGLSPQGPGIRTSPGLTGGFYAGCKFSEPPLPSALPLPPKHWTQTGRPSNLAFHNSTSALASEHKDVTQQLKLLLKVQA
ncbi:unnamed protein product [Phyllotreta striolata]|uniref:Proline-rich nuclear receptor coactivator 2 n=1 Tax=Phyllotreta striolata TaxID=444603 RepID=A0A9N9XT00_PHYSR|nr:unnamed protein product [Phyllotreta striolata]